MNGFRFGLEAEYMLASLKDFRPLWYKDVTFAELDQIFEGISLEGIPSLEGLAAEPPHKKMMPFIVEGYGMPDENFVVKDALPKGIEIRTPVCQSIDELFQVFELLYARVKKALADKGMAPIAISHHPLETKFSGPQNKRRHDFWLWAMEVMTTYGPDVNVSFPKEITDRLFSNLDDLNAKVNYYAPALAAISLASPFFQGAPWMIKGQRGKSYRTFKRSIVAPAIELHPDEKFRIEFKVFEMTTRTREFRNYFLLVLALFLDEGLKGRSSQQERIYDLGAVARFGIKAEGIEARLEELLGRAPQVLSAHGFDPSPLKSLNLSATTSDRMVSLFDQGRSINEIMREFSVLETLSGERI
ncbi:MAG: glutamate-cysteine ligase family protein [Bacteriovoracaceae bacterium]